MSKVRLVLQCLRRGHELGRVVDGPSGTMLIEIAKDRAGRTRWFPLKPGSAHRYECACGLWDLIRDEAVAEAIKAGHTKWFIR